jgi:predicted transcriptional regulator
MDIEDAGEASSRLLSIQRGCAICQQQLLIPGGGLLISRDQSASPYGAKLKCVRTRMFAKALPPLVSRKKQASSDDELP